MKEEPLKAANAMRTVVNSDKLRTLFQAYQDKMMPPSSGRLKNIIAEEIAANHHVVATEMQRALGPRRDTMSSTPKLSELTTLPKDRRNGEDLLTQRESSYTRYGDAFDRDEDTSPAHS